MKHKIAQMEILGLAIVVVLMLVAAIFVIRFSVFKEPADYRKGFVSSELASNMINAFLKTTAQDCSQLTMTELLQDCAQAQSIRCRGETPACSYVQAAAGSIFEKTLNKWNMRYEFKAYVDMDRPLIRLGEACRAEKKSRIFPIPISGATMQAKLDICG
ncbi:MAG: hypothetical protein AABX33_07925 [Nanoarchaeota archaeon]